MAIKLIAVDIDDTLITDEQVIPERCKEAITAAVAKGIRVVLASGRMWQSSMIHARRLGLSGPLITYNGGLVKHTDGTTVLHEPVPLDAALEVVRFARANDLHLNAYVDDKLYVEEMNRETEEYVALAGVPAHPVGDFTRFLTEPPTKLLFIVPPASRAELAAKLTRLFGHKMEITSSKSHFVEITRKGISKGKALATLASQLEIKREQVMAIGDGLNDVSMIEYAGIGVAVGNADEELRQRADFVTVSNEEGGVAEAIERFAL